MIAYHNDPAIKSKYVNRVIAHRKADNLIQGTGWDDVQGCSVGCTFEAYDHSRGPREIGVPEWLMRVNDAIFEGLPKERAMEWPERFLSAINLGADLERIKAPFTIFILESTLDNFDHEKFPDVKSAVNGVIDLYRDGNWSAAWAAESAARSAGSAAWAAESAGSSARYAAGSARYAAWAARSAGSAARSARSAESAARSAESAGSSARYAAGSARYAAWAAESAAESAARSAESAGSSAESAAYEKFADKIIDLIKSEK